LDIFLSGSPLYQVRGKNGTTRLDNLKGWNGSHTKVPRTLRLKLKILNFVAFALPVGYFELLWVLFGERRHN